MQTWLNPRNISDYPQNSVQFVMYHWKPSDCKNLTNVKKCFPTHLAERLKYSHQFRFSCSWKVHAKGFTLFKISLSLSMFLFSSTELSALLCSLLYALLILSVMNAAKCSLSHLVSSVIGTYYHLLCANVLDLLT